LVSLSTISLNPEINEPLPTNKIPCLTTSLVISGGASSKTDLIVLTILVNSNATASSTSATPTIILFGKPLSRSLPLTTILLTFIFILSAVTLPINTPYFILTKPTIASSIEFPPVSMFLSATTPPAETTLTAVLPPPMSTTIPENRSTDIPTPIVAATAAFTNVTSPIPKSDNIDDIALN